jgi:hypothetical protein
MTGEAVHSISQDDNSVCIFLMKARSLSVSRTRLKRLSYLPAEVITLHAFGHSSLLAIATQGKIVLTTMNKHFKP